MPRFKKFQNSFLGGEIDPEFLMRGDAETANQSCKSARNVALLTGGGGVRRPGTRRLAAGSGRRYQFFRTKFGVLYGVAFDNTLVTLLDPVTGATIGTIASPWTTGQIAALQFVAADGGVYVFSQFHMPRFISYEGALALTTFAFGSGVDGITQQPYYRFSPRGTLMGVSATTGVITLSFSAPVLLSGHVGTIFRRSGKEIRVDAVTNSTTATATVLQELFPTYRVLVVDGSQFRPGQIVSGSETTSRAEVVSVVGNGVFVLMLDSYGSYYHDTGNPTLSEKLVGPTGSSQITATPTLQTPAAALEWDEQMISSVRGYPSVGGLHRNRLIMAGFPEARNFIAASAIGDTKNFDTRSYDTAGVDANDAFVEGIGVDDVMIRHVASLENFIVLTDRGIFYVPEFEFAFAPGAVRFFKIGPEGSSTAQPAIVTEGLIFADVSGGKVMAVIPTGLVGRPWELRELSQAASHLINSPQAIFGASSVGARRHRMIFVLNANGTVAVLSYVRFENFAGWALWDSPGATFETMAIDEATVWVGFLRGANRALCVVDWGVTLDEAVDYGPAAAHASKTVTISWDGHFCGIYALDGSGNTAEVSSTAGMKAGFDFSVKLEPFPPYDVESGRNPNAVTRMYVHVRDSGAFKVDGEYWSPYTFVDNLQIPPRLRTGDVEFHTYEEIGESFLTTKAIEQTECAPLHVQALTLFGRF